MPAFAYRAIDAAGKRHRGEQEAASPQALVRALEDRGLVVVDVASAAESAAARRGAGGRAHRQAVLEVTRALASLLSAGLPLARALKAASNVTTGAMAETLAQLRGRVERGESPAAALAGFPDVFPPLYVGMVRAGERSGDLAGAFARLAEQLERQDALRNRLLSAAIYPLLLAVSGAIAVGVLLVFVLPKFGDLLAGTGAQLPRSTAFMLAVSGTARRYWPVVAALPVLAVVAAAWLRTTAAGQRLWSGLLLSLPLAGALRRDALAARFARLLGVLLGGGAPLLTALDDVAGSVTDPRAVDEVMRIRAAVREGVPLNRATGDGRLFPPLLAQLLAVGEESGRLQDFASKAADIFEARTERSLQRLVTLLEPAMIVFFGGVVGLVAMSLLQAIYSVNAGSFR